ncbi:hypothetical protein GW17_00053375 [Ensete ventricosum]|nr:hypothetical protein GW17_00053375 [Ensete ventricosum]
MVETRRSSASSKRLLSSSSSSVCQPASKRPKEEPTSSPKGQRPVPKEEETPAADDQPAANLPAEAGDAAVQDEKPVDAPGQGSPVERRKLEVPAKRVVKAKQKTAWAKLISQHSQVASTVFKSLFLHMSAAPSCGLRSHGTNVDVGEHHEDANCKVFLFLNSLGRKFLICWQIYQQLKNEKSATAMLQSSLDISELKGFSAKEIQIETRSGDSSAVAGASILASLSNNVKDLSAIPPASNAENAQEGLEKPVLASVYDASEDCSPDLEKGFDILKETFENDGGAVVPSDNTDAVTSSDLGANETIQHDNIGPDSPLDDDIGKNSSINYEIRSGMRTFAGTPSSEMDLTGNAFKVIEDQRELLKDVDLPASLPTTRCQTFKDGLKRGILDPGDIQVSFERFPYYLR